MRKKIKILNIIAIVLVLFQLLSYSGSIGQPSEAGNNTAENIGYYLGYNSFLIVAVILFIKARSLKQKMQKEQQQEEINAIGSNE